MIHVHTHRQIIYIYINEIKTHTIVEYTFLDLFVKEYNILSRDLQCGFYVSVSSNIDFLCSVS